MTTVAQLLAHKKGPVRSIEAGKPVLEAIKVMAQYNVGALLVMQGSKLHGIVSERDYARKVILMGRASGDTPVSQIMSSPVHTVMPDQSVEDCMQIMTDKRCRHLPVVDSEQNVVGVLSIGDLVRALLDEQQQTIVHLESYIRG
jgi:CBS domain-containing protein